MAGFNGLRVLSFESRRAQEIAQLIRNCGGVPIVAPSTREVPTPTEDEQKAIRRILDKEFNAIIFMTGVGARGLIQAAEAISSRQEVVAALGRARIVARGPKSAGVMREYGVPITLTVPEPNTWREILRVIDEHPEEVPVGGSRIAVQEHGEASTELYEGLGQRGAEVTPIRVYRWELPEDTAPLENAVRELAESKIDVVLFTSSVQLVHALRIADRIGMKEPFLTGLQRAMVASIGPISSETLREHGIRIDLEPSHPKMGFLVKEAAEKALSWCEQGSRA